MSTITETALVEFHGQQLLTIKDGATIRVAMRPVCDGIGLDWSSQRQRILRHPVLSEGVVIITTPSEGGHQETTTLPLDMLNGWLFGINTSRVKPELRESLIAYQRECFSVLADYWTKGAAIRPGALSVTQVLASQREARKLMQALKTETIPTVRRALHAQLERINRMLGHPVPALNEIGQDAPAEPPLIAEFWEAYEYLTNAGERLNHSRDPLQIAINMIEFVRVARARGLQLPPASAFRRVLRQSSSRKFVGTRTVNSVITRRSVKCWAFVQPPVEAEPNLASC